METPASTVRKATIIYHMQSLCIYFVCLPTPFNAVVYNCLFYKFLIAFLKEKVFFLLV